MTAWTCDFCKKGFQSEANLLNHLCERKRRFLQRDDKSVKLAYMAYQRFYKKGMGRTPPNLTAFEASQFYSAFVRFARRMIDINAINPMAFVEFLVRNETKIDKWTHPAIYSTYIRELNKAEKPLEAIERNLLLMEQWAMETGERWQDFLRKVSPSRAVLWVIGGRISPWLLLTASSAPALWERLNEEQLGIMNQAIDVEYWSAKLARHQTDVEQIRLSLKEDGI